MNEKKVEDRLHALTQRMADEGKPEQSFVEHPSPTDAELIAAIERYNEEEIRYLGESPTTPPVRRRFFQAKADLHRLLDARPNYEPIAVAYMGCTYLACPNGEVEAYPYRQLRKQKDAEPAAEGA